MGKVCPHGVGSLPQTGPFAHKARDVSVRSLPLALAGDIFERRHYLHSMPAGTRLCFGAFVGSDLMGGLSLGVGPINAHRLVEGATSEDVLTLSRLWLDDALPRNSESRFIGQVIRLLRQHTGIKFLLSYADPAAGHVGYVYQATNWVYTGLSQAQPLLDLGDGVARHTRTVSSALGTHSLAYLRRHGVQAKTVPRKGKHRYIYFVDRRWRKRLTVPILPYPKGGDPHGHS